MHFISIVSAGNSSLKGQYSIWAEITCLYDQWNQINQDSNLPDYDFNKNPTLINHFGTNLDIKKATKSTILKYRK